MHRTGALHSLPCHLLFWGLSERRASVLLLKTEFPPLWYRGICCKNNTPFRCLCMKVRPVVAFFALASLVQVGWWVQQPSEAVQKHTSTGEQGGKKKSWHLKSCLSARSIWETLFPTQDHIGNKEVFITCHGIYVWAPGVEVSKADQNIANACGDLVTISDQYVCNLSSKSEASVNFSRLLI